jgi:hypothetical protein
MGCCFLYEGISKLNDDKNSGKKDAFLLIAKDHDRSAIWPKEGDNGYVVGRATTADAHRTGRKEPRKVAECIVHGLLVDLLPRGGVHQNGGVDQVVDIVRPTGFVQHQVPIHPAGHPVAKVFDDVGGVEFSAAPRPYPRTASINRVITHTRLGVEYHLVGKQPIGFVQLLQRDQAIPVEMHGKAFHIVHGLGVGTVHLSEPMREYVALVVPGEDLHVLEPRISECWSQILRHKLGLQIGQPAQVQPIDRDPPEDPVHRFIAGREGPKVEALVLHQLQEPQVIVGPHLKVLLAQQTRSVPAIAGLHPDRRTPGGAHKLNVTICGHQFQFVYLSNLERDHAGIQEAKVEPRIPKRLTILISRLFSCVKLDSRMSFGGDSLYTHCVRSKSHPPIVRRMRLNAKPTDFE